MAKERSCFEENTFGHKDYLERPLKLYDFVIRGLKDRYGGFLKQRVVGFTENKVRVCNEHSIEHLDDWVHRRKSLSYEHQNQKYYYEPSGPTNVDSENLIIYARGTKDSSDPLIQGVLGNEQNFIIDLDAS